MHPSLWISKVYAWARWNKGVLACAVLLAIFANAFLYWFLQQEDFVYFWDWAFYESQYAYAVHMLQQGIVPSMKALLHSVAYTDHSLIVPFMLAPFGYIFGATRVTYLFLILNLCVIPSLILFGLLFRQLLPKDASKKWLLLPAVITLFTVQFWIPLVLGFYDVASWVIILIIWLLVLSRALQYSTVRAITLGVLLAGLLFVRRWYGYWVAAFFPALVWGWLWSRIKKQQSIVDFRFILICSVAMLTSFLLFGAPIVQEMLRNNYADMFQAFKLGKSLYGVLFEAMIHYGWLSLGFALVGFIMAVRKKGIAQFITVIGIQLLLTLLMFARVQRIDQHHQYQFIIVIVLCQALFLWYLWQSKIAAAGKWALSLVFACVMLINFLQGLVPGMGHRIQFLHAFSGAEHYPSVRHDISEIQNVVNFLDTQTVSDSKVYTIASSTIFNDDILRNSCIYIEVHNPHVCDRFLQSSHADTRDGFPQNFLTADLVVVADPVQYHLLSEDQQVIGVLANQFLQNTTVGHAFVELPEQFHLDKNVIVKIYKKTREFNPEELVNLQNTFLQSYPGREKLFDISTANQLN